jgi:hypothetical protein
MRQFPKKEAQGLAQFCEAWGGGPQFRTQVVVAGFPLERAVACLDGLEMMIACVSVFA